MKTDKYISWDRVCVCVCVCVCVSVFVVVTHCKITIKWDSLVDPMVKNMPAMWEA